VSGRADPLAEAVRGIRERYGFQAVARGVPTGRPIHRAPVRDPFPPWWADRLPAGHRLVELAGPASCGKLSLALVWLASLRDHGLIAPGGSANREAGATRRRPRACAATWRSLIRPPAAPRGRARPDPAG
jgi:hypothetical protein